MSSAQSLADAYAHCESVTRRQAANFYYGIRLLPPEKRRALCAVYAFARRVDDVGDGDLPSETKLHRLDDARRSLELVEDAELHRPLLSGHNTPEYESRSRHRSAAGLIA